MKIKQIMKKADWAMDADTRTPQELKDQVSGLSDDTLKKWAQKKGKTGRAQLQDKLVARELKKRGLTLDA